MSFATTVQVTVHADPNYQFTVSVGDDIELIYTQPNNPACSEALSFGSIKEMEAVARAMLEVCSLRKD